MGGITIFCIGKIVNTQGIKGEVRALATTFDATRFELLEYANLYKNDDKITLKIERVRYYKNFVILKFYGVNSLNESEKLRNYEILIPREEALPLGENEYYQIDLLGIEVFTSSGERLGEITDIIETGANDVYVVKSRNDNNDKNNKKEFLIPAIKECVKTVDIENKKMLIEPLEGLF